MRRLQEVRAGLLTLLALALWIGTLFNPLGWTDGYRVGMGLLGLVVWRATEDAP